MNRLIKIILLLASLSPILIIGIVPGHSAEENIPLDQVRKRVQALSKLLDPGKDMVWSPALTPPLPNAWPPSPATLWVQYAYARGHAFPPGGLADAELVSQLWLKIELHPETKTARLIRLSDKLKVVAPQGVRPLVGDEATLLQQSPALWDYAMRLKAPPDPKDPRTAAMLRYYRLWMGTNGVIYDQVAPWHQEFFSKI